jgi:hypothetical protein
MSNPAAEPSTPWATAAGGGDDQAPDSIDDLADRVRRWIALEALLFETLGRWARDAPEPAAKRTFATWCHRHAWHADLWRDRLPAIDGRQRAPGAADDRRGGRADGTAGDADGGDHPEAAVVDVWLEPLRRVLTDPATATTTEAKRSVLAGAVLGAVSDAIDEHRRAIDHRLDGPTARLLDLVEADVNAERREVDDGHRRPGF